MHTLTAAIPDYLAQSTGQVTITTFIAALVAVFMVFTIFGILRHPSGPGIVNLLVLLSAVFLGWSAARWPGINYRDGMFLGVFHMWLDSMRICFIAFLDLIGLDNFANELKQVAR
jgi:hypothetical protein